MNNEQWKQGGDCSKCRRQKYCKKECSEHKRMIDRVIREGLVKVTKGLWGGDIFSR